MIIYSWNMLYRNKELSRAFHFILTTPFDFFCLQEVPEEFLSMLKTTPYFLAYGIDVERVTANGIIPMYNVILSKHELYGTGTLQFGDELEFLPLRTRLFVAMMKPFHFSKSQNRGGVYSNAIVNGIALRIFSVHLALAHPLQRLRELSYTLNHFDADHEHVICGDFNILESPHINILNWLLGGRILDVLLYKRERKNIESDFAQHELANPLRARITHPFSRSQLDHILISKFFSITSISVLSDRLGSDHCPVLVTVSP